MTKADSLKCLISDPFDKLFINTEREEKIKKNNLKNNLTQTSCSYNKIFDRKLTFTLAPIHPSTSMQL